MKKVVSFFAGVGGIDLAFENAGFNVIWANEYDKNASKTYSKNFHNKLVVEDIKLLKLSDIPNSDVIVAGFPCQAFSVAGYRKGFSDDRGNLFFELMKIIEKKNPDVVFLENVKNLVGHDGGKTFRIIKEALTANGYYIKSKVLNSSEYGNVPQNRERIYIVAFKSLLASESFSFPEKTNLVSTIFSVIGFDKKVDEEYYYFPESCGFYDELNAEMDSNAVYQWRRVYVRKNKSSLVPTLTANMGTGGHNVPLIKSMNGIRKLTPRECFRIQGFPENFSLPTDVSNGQLYKQAGNSVVVPVVEKIAVNILKALMNK